MTDDPHPAWFSTASNAIRSHLKYDARMQTMAHALHPFANASHGSAMASGIRHSPRLPGSGKASGRPGNATMTRQKTTVTIVAFCVLVLHAVALWALQRGLSMHRPEIVVPVHLLARRIEPAQPIVPPQPVVDQPAVATKPTPPQRKPRIAKPKPAPVVQPAPPQPAPVQPVAPAPVLALETAAEPTRTVAPASTVAPTVQTDQPSTPGTTTAVAAAPPPPPSRPAPIPLELPSSAAHYLQNPRPSYPPMSLRLREQGTVLVDVLVSDTGLASEARLKKSSGFFRLDSAAVSTVLTWRFVPGKRAGVAEAMWFTVPIAFTIQ